MFSELLTDFQLWDQSVFPRNCNKLEGTAPSWRCCLTNIWWIQYPFQAIYYARHMEYTDLDIVEDLLWMTLSELDNQILGLFLYTTNILPHSLLVSDYSYKYL